MSQDIPFHQLQQLQCMHHGFTVVLFCIPVFLYALLVLTRPSFSARYTRIELLLSALYCIAGVTWLKTKHNSKLNCIIYDLIGAILLFVAVQTGSPVINYVITKVNK